MKYIVSLGALALLISAAFAYTTAVEFVMSRHTVMMTGEAIETETLTALTDRQLDQVSPTEIIELKDGDTFDLEATIVMQEVGNRNVKRLAYNGQIPGPVLKVKKGSKITVNFTNNIDMETALHAHGLRGDWRYDGAAPLTQDPIPVGETFTYQLEFPDTGIHWYHPHVREDYQQDMGLYGNVVVEEQGYWNQVDQEEYIILDDILEDGDFDQNVVSHTLMGRFGDTILINDREQYTLNVTQGEISRLFITSVANTRTFDIGFEGTAMKLVGGDIGRIENEEFVERVVIAPSERYIIELNYSEPGLYPITHRGEQIGTVSVAPSATKNSHAFTERRSNSADYAPIRSQMDTLLARAPDKNLRLDIEMTDMMNAAMINRRDSNDGETVTMMGMELTAQAAIEHCQMMPQMTGCEPFVSGESEEGAHSPDGIEWEDDMAAMNAMSNDQTVKWVIEDQDSGAKNEEINWAFNQGDLVKVRIHNDAAGMHPMQHPIHFHGQRFVVLAQDGTANDNLQWKDTVLVPSGQTVDLLVDMSNTGQWMAHCHIAEHLHSGMMFSFTVN